MLEELWNTLTDPSLRVAPAYLAAFILIAFAIYLLRRRAEHLPGFLAWLFPRRVYTDRSNLTDAGLFLVGRLMAFVGVFRAVGLRTLTTVAVVALAGAATGASIREAPWSAGDTVLVTAIYLLFADFAVYWVHRWHHEMPLLWPFHMVHHSAEVMTPLTVYRKHPVYDLLSAMISDLMVGLAMGLVLILVTNHLDMLAMAGIHAGYFLFNMFGSNFRHTHIWIGYGPVLERILISPAQHQIHHGRAVRHHDKNYGEVFALWDWMFGTLYVPKGREAVEFGLAERDGTPIPQPHPNLAAALLVPFRQFAAQLGARGRDVNGAAAHTEAAER
ncbi:MAG: sterol desaturase family protein [Alphaproteobacteria bacterium]